MPPLIHIALCHYQFEAIHPFLDGNGRVGRLLIMLLLVEQKILPSPLLYLSALFEATRDEYYKQLYNVSSKGTWHEWLIYFLNGVAIQAEDVLSRTERINALLNQWKIDVASSGSQVPVELVQHLAVNPYFGLWIEAPSVLLTSRRRYSFTTPPFGHPSEGGEFGKLNNKSR